MLMRHDVFEVMLSPVFLLGFGLLLLLGTDIALASEVSSTELPYEEGLSVLMESMTGPVAKFVAVIACAGGIITWIVVPDLGGISRLFLSLAIGASALIGVVALVDGFSGESALILAEHMHHSVLALGDARV